jgi:hypothetical protein
VTATIFSRNSSVVESYNRSLSKIAPPKDIPSVLRQEVTPLLDGLHRATYCLTELAVSGAIFGSDPCIFDRSPPSSLVSGVGSELPIVANLLLCAKTPPCVRVLIPPQELAFPNCFGALSTRPCYGFAFLATAIGFFLGLSGFSLRTNESPRFSSAVRSVFSVTTCTGLPDS